MIKRRFYKLEHSARDGSSSSSSSESDDEVEEEKEDVTQGEEDVLEDKDATVDEWRKRFSVTEDASSGSGYESEESSENVIDCDSTEYNGSLRGAQLLEEDHSGQTGNKVDNDDAEDKQSEINYFVLKHKSVFKCRICPRIICLSENTLLEHLKSKRHARSEKLLKEGRLKLMLNSDGEIEEDQETHAERHARTIAVAQNSEANKKKKRGRQRQKERRKRKSSKLETQTPKEEKRNRRKVGKLKQV